jgi:hypothetical protein
MVRLPRAAADGLFLGPKSLFLAPPAAKEATAALDDDINVEDLREAEA